MISFTYGMFLKPYIFVSSRQLLIFLLYGILFYAYTIIYHQFYYYL